MKSEVKTKWVEALRSGEYRQANAVLCTSLEENKAFCCLGVLLDVAGPGSWVKGWQGSVDYDYGDEFPLSENELNNELLDIVELPKDAQVKLIQMNDGLDQFVDNAKDFSQIADWIEENL